MPASVQSYLKKVSALCAHPDLSNPADRIDFLRRLTAYWTRQLNLHTRGKPIAFTPLEVDEILDFFEHEIRSLQNGRD